MRIFRWFTAHPAEVGESYGEHLVTAAAFGSRMLLAGMACIVHGVAPFLFTRTGSRAVSELNAQLLARRPSASATAALRADALRADFLNS